MATLSSALNFALAGLSVSSAQSAVVSRNVGSAGDENYSRKTAEVVTLHGLGPVVSQVTRASDRLLLGKLLSSISSASAQQSTLDALNRMSALTGDPQDGQSLTAALERLQDSLRIYEQNPADSSLARSAVETARAVAQKLNSASSEISSIRTDADKAMSDSVERINGLLSQFKVVNDEVIRGQGTAADLTDALDQRDSILKLLADEIGIRTSVRPNNDIQIYAEGGAILFEGSARSVSFAPSGTLMPGSVGGALIIDGVPVTGQNAGMRAVGGRITAYADIRDNLAPQLSTQLDDLAASLIIGFAERDPRLPAILPSVEGLFTADGTLPLLSNSNAGLAGLISINQLADPERGGSPSLIRDGGFGGNAYRRNTAEQAGYQARIAELVDVLDYRYAFQNSGVLSGNASTKEYSARSASWIEALRKNVQSSLDSVEAAKSRSSNSLAQVTGVSIDQEMVTLLDLEKSYQASSRVLSVVNEMLGTLLEVIR